MKSFWKHWIIMLLAIAYTGTAHGQEAGGFTMFDQGLVQEEQPIKLMSHTNEIPCETPVCEPACSSSFSFTTEVPILSLYANHGSGNSFTNWFNDFDYDPGLRLIAAYQSRGALGLRGRLFTYDATGSASAADRFDVRLYDFEATTVLNLGDWDILFFGGARFGNIKYSNRFSNTFETFDGSGITCGADLHRDVGGGFGLFGGFRQSYLYGDSVVNGNPNAISNTVIPITELRIGMDYTKQLRRGNTLIAGIGFEHQQYSSLSVRNNSIDPEDVDVALSGPVFSLTWLR
jgi:hypothetical protein